MTDPTPQQLANYFEKCGYKVNETERAYIIYKDNKYAPPILKEDQEISGTYLKRILGVFGISIEEFKQDYQGMT